MSENQQIQPGRIEALTGLRFLAAMMVFCFHLDSSLKTKVLYGPVGGIAVSFFFVLSGFILTYVYRDRLKWGGLKRFYFTRWARIWPLHAVCLLATLWLIPYAPKVDFHCARLVSHWLLLQSWIPDLAYLLSYNGVAWSISAEAFFYLMFPLFLLGGLRNFWWKCAATVAFTALALFAMTQVTATPESAKVVNMFHISHFNPAMRLLEFVSGMATAYLFMSTRFRSVRILQISRWPVVAQTVIEISALALAAFSFYILQWLGYYGWISRGLGLGRQVSYWMVYCGGMPFHALCIFVFAQSNGWVGRFFSTKLLIFLGEISFALYMVHRLIILMLIKHFWTGSTLPYWTIVSSSLVMTIGVSSLLFLMIEMPMKTALLKCYDRKFATGVRGLFGQTLQLFKHNTAYVSIAMVLVPIVMMNWVASETRSDLTADQVIAQSATPQIDFGDEIQLAAWHFEPKRLGTQVSLVWNTEQPVLLRHEYQLKGSSYAPKGKLYLKKGPTVQRFFVHQNHWSKGESFDLKLWKDGTLLSSQPAITGDEKVDSEPSYRLAVRPEVVETTER